METVTTSTAVTTSLLERELQTLAAVAAAVPTTQAVASRELQAPQVLLLSTTFQALVQYR